MSGTLALEGLTGNQQARARPGFAFETAWQLVTLMQTEAVGAAAVHCLPGVEDHLLLANALRQIGTTQGAQ